MSDTYASCGPGADCMWCRCPCHTITDERRVIPDGPPFVYGRDYSFPEGAERPDVVDSVVAVTHHRYLAGEGDR